MVSDTVEERARLAALCPAVDPSRLAWAVACARSRAFGPATDVFVLAPVLDMANHAFSNPNAEVVYAAPTEDAAGAAVAAEGELRVVARGAGVKLGEEVTYSCVPLPLTP